MNFILRIYVLSTLNVAVQHTEILIVTLHLTPDISEQPTLLLELRVGINRSHEIYYSFDSC